MFLCGGGVLVPWGVVLPIFFSSHVISRRIDMSRIMFKFAIFFFSRINFRFASFLS